MIFVPLANILQPLINVGDTVMRFFHDSVGFSWGFSIIALTITVRALLLPLTIKQFKSMQKMQQFTPQIKEIQTKYKHDRERQQQEMMKFYRENKINPAGACLPVLAQAPVFFALYFMLRDDLRVAICGQTAKPCNDIDPGSASFLFIPDITAPATGWVLLVLIVLYAGTQVLSSLMMMTKATDKNQRMIMLALPAVFIFFIPTLPAGLSIYWITTNIWTIGQQFVIKRTIGPISVPTPAGAKALTDETKAKPKQEKKSGGKEKQKSGERVPEKPPTPPRKKRKRTGRRR